jgi:Kdo2-lipid IVA lauroyltransferase/acyltransferase
MRSWVEFLFFQATRAIFFILPRSWCLAGGEKLGSLIYRLDGHHRKIAMKNLGIAYGGAKRPSEIRTIARASFLSFGRLMADIFKLFPLSREEREKLVTVEGWENLTAALAQGKGVLAFSAHLGNWEIGSLLLSKAAKLHVVARALDNKLMEKALVRFRNSLGANVIYKQQASRKVLQALRNGEIVAILIDQNVLRSQAVFVDFFGRPAATTPALGAFHLRTRAPLLPVFCLPTPGGGYRLKILPSPTIDLDGDIETNVLKITGTCTKMIEDEINKTPEAWLWFHDRWRSRPEKERGAQDGNP